MQTQNFFSSLDKTARQTTTSSQANNTLSAASATKKSAPKPSTAKAAKKKQPQPQPPPPQQPAKPKAKTTTQPQQQQPQQQKKKKKNKSSASSSSLPLGEEWETIPEHLLKEWAREAEELEKRQKLEEEQRKEIDSIESTTTTTTTTSLAGGSSSSLEELLAAGVLTKAQYKNIKKREKKRRAKLANPTTSVSPSSQAPTETSNKKTKDKNNDSKAAETPPLSDNLFSTLDKFEQKSQRISEKMERKGNQSTTTTTTSISATMNGTGKKKKSLESSRTAVSINSTAKSKGVDEELYIPIVYQPEQDKGLFALSEGIATIDDALDLPDIVNQHLSILGDSIDSTLLDSSATAFENASRQQSRLLRLLRQSSTEEEEEEDLETTFGHPSAPTSMFEQGLYNSHNPAAWSANTPATTMSHTLLPQNHFSATSSLFGGGVEVGIGLGVNSAFGLDSSQLSSPSTSSSFGGYNHFGHSTLHSNGLIHNIGNGGFLDETAFLNEEDEERNNRARLLEALGEEFDPNNKHKYVPPHRRSVHNNVPSSATFKPPRIVQPPPGFLPLFQPL